METQVSTNIFWVYEINKKETPGPSSYPEQGYAIFCSDFSPNVLPSNLLKQEKRIFLQHYAAPSLLGLKLN